MLKASDKGGSIIFIGSIVGGTRPSNSSTVYGMAKAAINQLAAHLACEWAKDNIRVNCVVPGLTRTAMIEQVYE